MKKDANDLDMGVIGSVSLLQNANLSTQPITSFDWSPDKVSIMPAYSHCLVTLVYEMYTCIMYYFHC